MTDPTIWNREVETMARPDLESLQDRLLQVTLRRVWDGSPYYRRKFKEAGVDPRDVRGREGLMGLPVTTKMELAEEQG